MTCVVVEGPGLGEEAIEESLALDEDADAVDVRDVEAKAGLDDSIDPVDVGLDDATAEGLKLVSSPLTIQILPATATHLSNAVTPTTVAPITALSDLYVIVRLVGPIDAELDAFWTLPGLVRASRSPY